VRDGDRLVVTVEGPKRISGVEFTGPGAPVIIN
jgi:alpha-D-xyloside xylohydrolase